MDDPGPLLSEDRKDFKRSFLFGMVTFGPTWQVQGSWKERWPDAGSEVVWAVYPPGTAALASVRAQGRGLHPAGQGQQ